VLEQQSEKLELAPRQLERLPAAAGGPRASVELDVAYGEDVLRADAAVRRPPQHGAHPCCELGDAERLDDVVVGTELEADNTIRLEPARGEHDHRHRRRPSELATDVAPVDVGKHQIEQDDVHLVAGCGVEPSATGRRMLDLEAFAFERPDERCRDRLLVFDQQHARHTSVVPADNDAQPSLNRPLVNAERTPARALPSPTYRAARRWKEFRR
jgi:hypothetical protein